MDRESPVVRVIRETLELANVPAWHAGGAVFDALGTWGTSELGTPEEVLRFVHGALREALSKRLGDADAGAAIAQVDQLLRNTSAPTGMHDRSTVLLKDSVIPEEPISSTTVLVSESQLPPPSAAPQARHLSSLPNGKAGAFALRIPPPPKLESEPPHARDLLEPVDDIEDELNTTDVQPRVQLRAIEERTADDLEAVQLPDGRAPDYEREDAPVFDRLGESPVVENLSSLAGRATAPGRIPDLASQRRRKESEALRLEPDETTTGLMLDAPERITPRPPAAGPLELESSSSTAPPPMMSDPDSVDVEMDVSDFDMPDERATMLIRTQGTAVPVVVIGSSEGFAVKLKTELGRNFINARTVGTPDDVRVAIATKPFVVIIDATDFAPIEPEELAQAIINASGSTDTVHAIWGMDMPYGRSLAAQFNLAGASYVGLSKRDGLEPLLDIVRSRRG